MGAVSLLDPSAGSIVVVASLTEAHALVRGLDLVARETRAAGRPAGGLDALRSRLEAAVSVARQREIAGHAAAVVDPDALLSTGAAAGLLGCSARTVVRAIRSGDLAADRDGRAWLIRRGDLDDFARSDR